MGINKDQVEGRAKEAAGKVEEIAGKVAGSPTHRIKGKLKKKLGSVQADYGDAKERNRKEAEYDELDEHQARPHRP
jgi:uncharacterized protein YjbJ (UPF0337 family)